MSLAVFPLIVDDLHQFRHAALDDSVYGPLLELGAYGMVVDISARARPLDAILDLSFTEAATAAGARIGRDLGAADVPAGTIAIVPPARSPAVATLHELLARDLTVSLLFAEETVGTGALWALVGRDVPGLGLLPACGMADLWATWLARVQVGWAEGRDLVATYSRHCDPDRDGELTERLRQLYGG